MARLRPLLNSSTLIYSRSREAVLLVLVCARRPDEAHTAHDESHAVHADGGLLEGNLIPQLGACVSRQRHGGGQG